MTDEQIADMLIPCRRAIALAATNIDKLNAIKEHGARLAPMIARGDLAKSLFVDAVYESSSDLINSAGEGAVLVAISTGLKNGLNGHALSYDRYTWVDMSKWDDEPLPIRKWAIPDRVPLNQAGLFSGEGGTGKSIIELMKNAAHVLGKDWLGTLPDIGGAFYIGAEDDEPEVHIRIAAIASHYGAKFADLINGGLKVMCLLGMDATLCCANKSGVVETTDLYKYIYEAAGDLKPKNISIDTLSRAFSGNEIDRSQVYGFAMHMQALAKVSSGSVTVLSHPSLQGVMSGSGISGSTAWHGAFRFRQYLKGVKPENGEEADSDLRELEFKKNQYGPIGAKIILRYQRGLFLPEGSQTSLERAQEENNSDYFFNAEIGRDEINVSNNPHSSNYAPRVFARMSLAKNNRLTEKQLEGAMNRLLEKGKIRVEKYGRPSEPRYRLVVNEQQL